MCHRHPRPYSDHDGVSHLPNGKPTLEEFLHKDTIGSLTGLTKRFSDLDLYDEPRKLPMELWPHVYLGMLACYLLRERRVSNGRKGLVWDLDDPRHPARQLLDRARDVFDANGAALYDLQSELMDPIEDQDHRFHVLMFDYAQIKRLEDRLLDRLGASHLRFPQEYVDAAVAKRYPDTPIEKGRARLKDERRCSKYRNLTQLMGIYIAQGSMRKALSIAHDLDGFPDRERYEQHGFSRAVTAYLRDGGAKTLATRAGGAGFLFNTYWYRHAFGNEKHPGKLYNLFNESRNEFISGIAGAGIGALGATVLLPLWHRTSVLIAQEWDALMGYLQQVLSPPS